MTTPEKSLTRTTFARITGLSDLQTRRKGGYEQLYRHILEHAAQRGQSPQTPEEVQAAASRWASEAYRPALREIEGTGALAQLPNMEPADLYLAISEHKWYQSERAGHDVGFAAAAADFAQAQARPRAAMRTCTAARTSKRSEA